MLIECLILLFVLLIYQRWKNRDIYRLGEELKTAVRTLPLFGHSYLFMGDNETRMKAIQTLGRDALKNENGISAFWLGSYLYTMVADPEATECVLKTCLEKDDVMKMATLFIGNGSVFAPVSIWRLRRKLLIPIFRTKNMKHFLSIFVKHSTVLVQQMNKFAGSGIVSAWNLYTAYTMDSIADSTIGYQMDAQKNSGHPFLKAFDEGLAHCAERLCTPWLHIDLLYYNLPIYHKMLGLKNYLWGFVKELIEAKRKEMKDELNSSKVEAISGAEEKQQTFMELLIKASGNDNGYTDNEILEELMVLMVAGNDTTAVASSFIALMLSRHPEVQEKVFQELRKVFGDSSRPITSEDLLRLKYLDAVIKETLRLYTPVPVITRKVEKEVILPSGQKLIPGTGVIVNIWALHRNPRYWGEDVEQFRPERFIDSSLKHPAAFVPFSCGPRNCIGNQFAITSMKTAFSSVLRRFKILPAKDYADSDHPPIRFKFDLMMKDCNGFEIKLERRITN